MDETVDILLVDWPFPYGPRRSPKNRFSQTGAKNHYLRRFGSADAWCLILDIDECLAVSGKKTFKQYLHDCEGNSIVEVLFDSFIVPPYQGQPAIANRRVSSYWFRNRERRGWALKFAFKPRHIEYVGPHMAYPKNRVFAKLIGLPRLYDKTLQFLYGSVLKRLSSKRIVPLFSFLISLRFGIRVPKKFSFTIFVASTRIGNRRELSAKEVESFDASRHVSDTLINELYTRARLNDEHGLPAPPTGRNSARER